MTSRRLQLTPLHTPPEPDERRSAVPARADPAAQTTPGGVEGRVRLVPARLPAPIRRTRRRTDVVIRAARAADARACTAVDARYTTTHVWQMDTRHEGDELRISFRQVRLPREMTLDTPHGPPALRTGTLPRGLLWLVAEEVEALPANQRRRPPSLNSPAGDPPADAGTIVGYAVAAAAPGDANAFLRTLVVDQPHRRKGIGGRLLSAAQRWAAAQGAAELMADVPARNYPALRLLQKDGFSFCGFNDRCYPGSEVALFFSYRLR